MPSKRKSTGRAKPASEVIEGQIVEPPSPTNGSAASHALVKTESPQQQEGLLVPLASPAIFHQQHEQLKAIIRDYLIKADEEKGIEGDYGRMPGTKKDTLFQSGAHKLCEIYGFVPTFPNDRRRIVEDWSKTPPLFDYEITCVLLYKGQVRAEGIGSCNSYETKYRYREQTRHCPVCDVNGEKQPGTIFRSNKDGEGFYCWRKKGGCGAQFEADDPAILEQPINRIDNPDVADQKNTILKIGVKRSLIAATITATRSSGIFTQDLEDNRPERGVEREDGEQHEVREVFVGTILEVKPKAKSNFLAVKVKYERSGKPQIQIFALQKKRSKELALKKHYVLGCVQRYGPQQKPYWEISSIQPDKGPTKQENRAGTEQDVKNLKEGEENRGHGQEGTKEPQPQPQAKATETKPEPEPQPAEPEKPHTPIEPTFSPVERDVTVGKKTQRVKWSQVRGEVIHFTGLRSTSSGSQFMQIKIAGLPGEGTGKKPHDTFILRHKHLFDAMRSVKRYEVIVFDYEEEITQKGQNAGKVWQNIEDVGTIGDRTYRDGVLVETEVHGVPGVFDKSTSTSSY